MEKFKKVEKIEDLKEGNSYVAISKLSSRTAYLMNIEMIDNNQLGVNWKDVTFESVGLANKKITFDEFRFFEVN